MAERPWTYCPTQPPITAVILVKAPIAGHTKTRLIPALGAVGAARLHTHFLWAQARHVVAATLGPVQFHVSQPHPVFLRLQKRFGGRLITQATGDLGERLRRAVQQVSGPLLILGTDCPALVPAQLRRAGQLLSTHQSVMIPALDGGYVLLGGLSGSRLINSGVFDNMPWSTDAVADITRERLRGAGLSFAEMAPLADIDLPSDYAEWQRSALPERQARREPI